MAIRKIQTLYCNPNRNTAYIHSVQFKRSNLKCVAFASTAPGTDAESLQRSAAETGHAPTFISIGVSLLYPIW